MKKPPAFKITHNNPLLQNKGGTKNDHTSFLMTPPNYNLDLH